MTAAAMSYPDGRVSRHSFRPAALILFPWALVGEDILFFSATELGVATLSLGSLLLVGFEAGPSSTIVDGAAETQTCKPLLHGDLESWGYIPRSGTAGHRDILFLAH